MSNRFCTNCGTQLVDGAAFCTSCGAPATATAAAPSDVQPTPIEEPSPPAPPPQEAPPAFAAPPPVPAPPFVDAPPPVAGPAPFAAAPAAGWPTAPKPGGLSRRVVIGIVIVVVLAVVIAIFVRRSEREFQRQRRAHQVSAGTSGSPPTPVTGTAGYGGFDSGGTVGSDGWVRNQLVGSWTETRNCTNPIQFRADGTTNSGRWTFQGGRLSLIESNGTAAVEVVSIGTEEMVLANSAGGRQMTWRRC